MEIEEDEGLFALTLGEHVIMAAGCIHAVRKFAQHLDRARGLSYRGAMQLLTEELGMCETYAKHLFHELQTDHRQEGDVLQ